MATEKKVILLVGQRGSGKSHYAENRKKEEPDLHLVSRDAINIRLFGSVHCSPYTGAQHATRIILGRLLRRKLSTRTNITIVLDCWTGNSSERKSLIRELRKYGADQVDALYFITPADVVDVWFWQKPGIAKWGEMTTRKGENLAFFSENAPRHDHRLFHELASTIDSDGFDNVIRFDPHSRTVTV